VAEAYYFAAETLAEYLDDPKAAAEYYRRAYQADPALLHPARFQRATLLDFRLGKPKEAIEEYRDVVTYESVLNAKWARPNADFASDRIRFLERK
jgi:tetratricopeptide (TPR) repeat protein